MATSSDPTATPATIVDDVEGADLAILPGVGLGGLVGLRDLAAEHRVAAICLGELAAALLRQPGAEPLAAGELVSSGTLTAAQQSNVAWLVLIIIPCLTFGTGVYTWWKRR